MASRRRFVTSALGATPLLKAAFLAAAPPDVFPADDDPKYWEKLRKLFDLREDEVFFNTATLGASPRPVVEAVTKSVRDLSATIAEWDYKPDRPNWFTGYDPEDRVREKLARLLGARREEIALTQNATMGMNFVAMGLDLSAGDEVIQTDQEHPGGRCGWELRGKRHGVVRKVVTLPVPANDPAEVVDLVRKAITPKTKVIAWPHITSALGTIQPVKEICALAKERGIFTVLDGAQAIGQIPLDLKDVGCDAYFGSPHKWLLAPAGNGFMYVDGDTAKRVWTTLASTEWANEKDPGYRLQQRGTGSLSLLVGLEAAIDFFERVGRARWTSRIKELGDHLRAGLKGVDGALISSSVHPGMCAGITTWRIAGVSPAKMMDWYWEKARLRPRAVGEERGLRTSTMIYNSKAEIDRLVALARTAAKDLVAC